MSSPWAKFIPTAVLVAILGYLGYSYLSMEPVPPPTINPPAKLATELLRPETPEETTRDPFGDSVRFVLGETTKEKPGTNRNRGGGKKADAKSAATGPGKVVDRKTSDVATQPGEKGVPRTAPAAPRVAAVAKLITGSGASPATASKGPAVPAGPLAHLVLNATLLEGENRVAMINGRAYHPGDKLVAPAPESPFTVSEIHRHHVVLARDGQLLDLNYRDRAAAATTGPPGRGPRATGGNAQRRPAAPVNRQNKTAQGSAS